VARDPNYALAYAGLADTYNFLGDSGYVAPKQVWPKAKSAAMQAVKIDDMLSEAHISLALVREGYDWDWPGAETEFKRAIQLNANSATAHHWYGDFLARLGRSEEARTELKKAQYGSKLRTGTACDRGSICPKRNVQGSGCRTAKGVDAFR